MIFLLTTNVYPVGILAALCVLVCKDQSALWSCGRTRNGEGYSIHWYGTAVPCCARGIRSCCLIVINADNRADTEGQTAFCVTNETTIITYRELGLYLQIHAVR